MATLELPTRTTPPATNPSSGAVALVGYISDGPSGEYRHLNETPGHTKYLVIRVEHIIGRVPPAGDNRVKVQVRQDAIMAMVETVTAASFATPLPSGARHPWPRD